jgi:hypothetical protein
VVTADRVEALRDGQEVHFRSHAGRHPVCEEPVKLSPPRAEMVKHAVFLRRESDAHLVPAAPFLTTEGQAVFLMVGRDRSGILYSGSDEELSRDRKAEAEAELRARVPFLLDPSANLGPLEDLVRMAAADGRITVEEFAALVQKAVAVGLAQDNDEAQGVVNEAIALFAPDVFVEAPR